MAALAIYYVLSMWYLGFYFSIPPSKIQDPSIKSTTNPSHIRSFDMGFSWKRFLQSFVFDDIFEGQDFVALQGVPIYCSLMGWLFAWIAHFRGWNFYYSFPQHHQSQTPSLICLSKHVPISFHTHILDKGGATYSSSAILCVFFSNLLIVNGVFDCEPTSIVRLHSNPSTPTVLCAKFCNEFTKPQVLFGLIKVKDHPIYTSPN